jgi:hypothetical protein
MLESVCCLLVLDTVTSTSQWIRQPKPRGCVFVFVCKYVLGRSLPTHPLNLLLCLLWHFDFLTSPHVIPTRSGCHPNSFRLLLHSTSSPHRTVHYALTNGISNVHGSRVGGIKEGEGEIVVVAQNESQLYFVLKRPGP